MKIIDKLLDLLYPPKCPFCHDILTEKAPVCSNCMESLPFVPEKSCEICANPLEEFSHRICVNCRNRKNYFEHSFVPLIYKQSARDAAVALKTAHPYYAKAFAYLLANKILSSEFYTDFKCITYVPQSKRKNRERGYNQAELIAKELSKLLNIPCIPTLWRSNDGKPQHTLNAVERRENVRKCYFKTDAKGDGTVLLVDDIYTTGATANYCSKLLRRMGFEKVYLAIALIRTND